MVSKTLVLATVALAATASVNAKDIRRYSGSKSGIKLAWTSGDQSSSSGASSNTPSSPRSTTPVVISTVPSSTCPAGYELDTSNCGCSFEKQSMEGALKCTPGQSLFAGYQFTPSGTQKGIVSLVHGEIEFLVQCANGDQHSFNSTFPTDSWDTSKPSVGDNSNNYPCGKQDSSLTYQSGAITAPDLCNGQTYTISQGTNAVFQFTGAADSCNVQYHYGSLTSDGGHIQGTWSNDKLTCSTGTSWSATQPAPTCPCVPIKTPAPTTTVAPTTTAAPVTTAAPSSTCTYTPPSNPNICSLIFQEGFQDQACNSYNATTGAISVQCYNPACYTCTGTGLLCPVSAPYNCNGACYDDNQYTCDASGNLQQIPGGSNVLKAPAFCPNATSNGTIAWLTQVNITQI